MKIINKGIITAAILGASAFAASAAQAASDGMITFSGKVTAQTCVINGGPAGATFTVNMPTVTKSDLAAGDAAGRTPFALNLTACNPAGGTVSTFFEADASNVDLVANDLLNQAPTSGSNLPSNVHVELLNSDATKILVGKDAVAENSKSVTFAGATATLNYYAQYRAPAASAGTEGAVLAKVNYTLNYN